MDEATPTSGPSRRSILKGAVGVGVGVAAWSEPSVRGIARTPAFAQSGSPTCMPVNSFQWNTSSNPPGGLFGWNGQPCSGSNNSPYTVDPVGGASVCAGAWGNASVTLTGNTVGDEICVQINDGASLEDCYIEEILAIRTNGTVCESSTGGVGTKSLCIDMSCINSANKRVDINVNCVGGLGC